MCDSKSEDNVKKQNKKNCCQYLMLSTNMKQVQKLYPHNYE